MLSTICQSCSWGFHDTCEKGRSPLPGFFGGWKCVCTHTKDEEFAKRRFHEEMEGQWPSQMKN